MEKCVYLQNDTCSILTKGARCYKCSFFKTKEMYEKSLAKANKRIREIHLGNAYSPVKQKRDIEDIRARSDAIYIDAQGFERLVYREESMEKIIKLARVSRQTINRALASGRTSPQSYEKFCVYFGRQRMEKLKKEGYAE